MKTIFKKQYKKEAAEATSFSICDTFVQNLALICEHLYMDEFLRNPICDRFVHANSSQKILFAKICTWMPAYENLICDRFVLFAIHLYMNNITDCSAVRGGCASFPSCAARC